VRSLPALAALSLCALNAVDAARAGAWTAERGEGYWKFDERVTVVDFYHDGSGAHVAAPGLGDYTTSFYGEYGATERVTPFAYTPFVEKLTLDLPGAGLTKPADIDLGVRIGLLKKGRGVLSLQFALGVPTGSAEPVDGLVTGDGEWNLVTLLQAGRSFASAPVYISGELGFNERTRGFSDEARFGFEVGWTFHPRWSLTGRVRGVFSLDNGDGVAGTQTLGLYANDVEYILYGPELGVALTKDLWLAARYDTAKRVRNSIGGPTYALSLAFKTRPRKTRGAGFGGPNCR